MDAQPDFEKLSQAFLDNANANNAASQEIKLLANIPAVHGGQRLYDAVQSLTTDLGKLVTKVDSIATKVDNLTNTVNTLGARVDTLGASIETLKTHVDTRFDSLELRLSAESVSYFSFIKVS